nr:hypothetical protein [Tanacetum cinerariifolium]
YTKIDINYAAGGNFRRLSTEEASKTIKDCAQCDKHWKKPTNTISDQIIANLKTQLDENEVVRVMIPKCMSWLDAYDEPIGDMENKVDNPSPQSIPQVILSFEVYTPPVTYPKEVEKTIGVPVEVEPLHEPQLEDLCLNTCNHDIPLSSREVPSFDEPKPQPQPLPNCPPLGVNLGDKRGTDPPIKPHSLNNFRMKVADKSTINTPPSPHNQSGMMMMIETGFFLLEGLESAENDLGVIPFDGREKDAEDCLDGCDGAGGGVNLRVVNSLLGDIPRDVMGERGGDTIRVDGGAIW